LLYIFKNFFLFSTDLGSSFFAFITYKFGQKMIYSPLIKNTVTEQNTPNFNYGSAFRIILRCNSNDFATALGNNY
jgi:hypothetical protein